MAELYVVRHAQASFGTADYDRLSAVGERQGVWLGEYFAERDLVFDRMVIGTLRRHEETLQLILRGMRCEVERFEQNPALDEYDFRALFDALGDQHRGLKAMADRSTQDFFKALKQVLHLWSRGLIEAPIPETWDQFQGRVAAAMRDIRSGGSRRVLVVTSGGPMGAMAQQVLQAPADAAIALNMQIRNSSFCQYYFNAEGFQLASLNNVPHLDRAGRREFLTYG